MDGYVIEDREDDWYKLCDCDICGATNVPLACVAIPHRGHSGNLHLQWLCCSRACAEIACIHAICGEFSPGSYGHD